MNSVLFTVSSELVSVLILLLYTRAVLYSNKQPCCACVGPTVAKPHITRAIMSGYSVNKNTVDVSVDPRTKNHWKRHRKAEVDLLHGAPFALDRQLEDQKYQLEFNKV